MNRTSRSDLEYNLGTTEIGRVSNSPLSRFWQSVKKHYLLNVHTLKSVVFILTSVFFISSVINFVYMSNMEERINRLEISQQNHEETFNFTMHGLNYTQASFVKYVKDRFTAISKYMKTATTESEIEGVATSTAHTTHATSMAKTKMIKTSAIGTSATVPIASTTYTNPVENIDDQDDRHL
jgi:hypothetical protein